MNLNQKSIVLTLGSLLIVVGVLGLTLESNDEPSQSEPREMQGQTLEVKNSSGDPQSTVDYIQGSGGLQNQGSQPQSGNAGSALQPNAGADSLPTNY